MRLCPGAEGAALEALVRPRAWAAWGCGGVGERGTGRRRPPPKPGGAVVVVVIPDGHRGVSTWTRPSRSAGSVGLWTPRWDLRHVMQD